MTLGFLAAAIFATVSPQSSGDYYGRLLDPIASHSRPGTQFRVRIVGPADASEAQLPFGYMVQGVIRKAHSIGLGLRRERAQLQLGFSGCIAPDGRREPCEVKLRSIDNARECVSSENKIRGILAASNPHSWLSGVWYRPGPMLFHRSTMGLTGAGGFVKARLGSHPAFAAGIVASRLLFYKMPNPEIELPAGTEFVLRIASAVWEAVEERAPAEPSEILDEVLRAPASIMHPERGPVADRINIALLGTQAELEEAFAAAGWVQPDRLTKRSAARAYSAFTSMGSYPTAPVSPLHYQGRLPDLVFQKSFNTVSKRHHVRFWQEEAAGQQIWLGAATHDVAITFDWNRFSFTHRIDPAIDRERQKIRLDLEGAGCLRGYEEQMRFDGESGVFLATLQSCTGDVTVEPFPGRRRNLTALGVRRVVLETRQYVTRGNAYYWLYRGLRHAAGKRGDNNELD